MLGLRPFFCYFGGKWRAAPHYPAPRYASIVEPFAGAAGYATRYFDRDVLLIEKNEMLAALWRYLIDASPEEIRSLPLIRGDQTVADLGPLPQEAKWLIGFWLSGGITHPYTRPSSWFREGLRPNSKWGAVVRDLLASQVNRIKHWRVLEGSYSDAPDVEATWFVDPPYEKQGSHYKHGSKEIDFPHLAAWSQRRAGQVMVCENAGATWLPFKPFRTIKGSSGKHRSGKSVEVLWQDPLSEMLS